MLPSEMEKMIRDAAIDNGLISGWWGFTKKSSTCSLVFSKADDGTGVIGRYERGLLTSPAWAAGRLSHSTPLDN